MKNRERVLCFLAKRFPASYTALEIAHRLGIAEKDVINALDGSDGTWRLVTRTTTPITKEVVWSSNTGRIDFLDSEPLAEKTEDTDAALERDVGHATASSGAWLQSGDEVMATRTDQKYRRTTWTWGSVTSLLTALSFAILGKFVESGLFQIAASIFLLCSSIESIRDKESK